MLLKKGSHHKVRCLMVAAQSYKNTDCGCLKTNKKEAF